MQGNDDRPNQRGGQQQADDFERQQILGHQLLTNLAHGDLGRGFYVEPTLVGLPVCEVIEHLIGQGVVGWDAAAENGLQIRPT